MKSLVVRLAGPFLALAALCLAIAAPAAGDLATALAAVRVPGSDFEIVSDAAKSNQSVFNQKMKELRAELEEEMDADALAMGKKIEEVMKSIGITEDSLNYMVLSLSIRGINTEAASPKVPGLVAFALKAPLNAGAIAENVGTFAAEQGVQVEFRESVYQGVPLLSAVFDPQNLPEDMTAEAAAALEDLTMALPAGGSVVYVGQSEQVQAAIDRMLARQPVARSAGLTAAKALVPDAADSYFIFDMPDAFRRFLSVQAQQAAGNPMVAGPMMALSGLKGASFSTVTTDKASVALSGDFEAAENAMQIKVALDMMMGMLKMQMMNMAGGQPMPFLDTLKTTNEGTKATLGFAITVEDIQSFVAFANRMQAGGMAPGGPAPGGVPAH